MKGKGKFAHKFIKEISDLVNISEADPQRKTTGYLEKFPITESELPHSKGGMFLTKAPHSQSKKAKKMSDKSRRINQRKRN
jgi:hypothetical protein